MIPLISIAIWMLTALAFCVGVKAAELTAERSDMSDEARAAYCLIWGVGFYIATALAIRHLILWRY